MTIEELVRLGKFNCPVCPERFKTLAEKKAHVKLEHPR